MRVFVLSREGYSLMPTTPRRARLWLKARRARVVRRDPFTIQLRFETTSYTQPVTVGVDTGSKAVGLAALANGEVLLQAEVQLRTDISEKLAQRRTYRRARRSRKTRYRPARWANRRRKAGCHTQSRAVHCLIPAGASGQRGTCQLRHAKNAGSRDFRPALSAGNLVRLPGPRVSPDEMAEGMCLLWGQRDRLTSRTYRAEGARRLRP